MSRTRRKRKRTDLYELPTIVKLISLARNNGLGNLQVLAREEGSTLGKRWSMKRNSGLPWRLGGERIRNVEDVETTGDMVQRRWVGGVEG